MSSISPGFIPNASVITTIIGSILTSFDGTTSYYLVNEDGNILVSV